MNTPKILLLTAAAAFGFGASAQTVAESLPGSWTADTVCCSPAVAAADCWWEGFGDAELTSLIERGQAANYDISAAARRIEVARQGVRQAQAAWMPSLGLNVGWSRSRSSGLLAGPEGQASTGSYFDLGVSASWEVDLFGRIRQRVRSADAAVAVSRAERAAAMVSLCSEIATDYFQLRMYQAELEVARQHIASQDTITEIALARHEAGLASMLDVVQARVVLYSTEATVPALESLITSTISSLATLTGALYDDLAAELSTPGPLPACYRLVEAGVPLDLLRRRPDIVEAEARLQQYAAALGIARADYLPTLSITGSVGTAAHRAGDLFKGPSLTYSVAPQLSWTVFDGLSRRAATASARAQMEAGIDNYNMTVLTAVNETNNAIMAYSTALRTIGLNERVVDESRRALELSVDGYTQGLTAFSNVVDAQMDLLQYRNSLITAHGNALVALVNLYRALGGGWQ